MPSCKPYGLARGLFHKKIGVTTANNCGVDSYETATASDGGQFYYGNYNAPRIANYAN